MRLFSSSVRLPAMVIMVWLLFCTFTAISTTHGLVAEADDTLQQFPDSLEETGSVALVDVESSQADAGGDVIDVTPAADGEDEQLEQTEADEQASHQAPASTAASSSEEAATSSGEQRHATMDSGSSSSSSSSAAMKASKLKLKCTPVYRDETNMTASLILVNVSTISNYLQLKVMPSSLEMSASVVISGAVSLATADTENLLTAAVGLPAAASSSSEEDTESTSPELAKGTSSGAEGSASGEAASSKPESGENKDPTSASNTSAPGECTLLIFYLDWCPFTAKAAAHFNAIGRLYPQLNILAIDAYTVYGTTMRYGVVGVPSAYLFHNNKLVSRYNHSEVTVEGLVEYLQRVTSLDPVGELIQVSEADRLGPLSSTPVSSLNYTLVGAWAFCLLVAAYYLLRSELFQRAKEQVLHMWNEAQFQHEHVD